MSKDNLTFDELKKAAKGSNPKPEPLEIPKSLHVTDIANATDEVPDLQVTGDGDMWQLLSKASSEREGWMKSTKAMHIKSMGCLVQVTTQQRNYDDSYSLAEAVVFVPGVTIAADENGGKKLTKG